MDILSEKLELAKKLLETDDPGVLGAIRSVFDESEASGEWGTLPDEVVADIRESIEQIDSNQGITHDKARETFRKWL